MSTASLFATCALIRGITGYAITLQLAAASPAVGMAQATAGHLLAPNRSVKSRA